MNSNPANPDPRHTDDRAIHEVLTGVGQRWRAVQPPPPPVRLDLGGAVGRHRWPALRRWAPVAAVASVLVVIGGIALPVVLRAGTPPGPNIGGVGSASPGSTGPAAIATLPPDQGQGVPVRGGGVLVREQDGSMRFCGGFQGFSAAEVACGPISIAATGVAEAVFGHTTGSGQAYSDWVVVTGRYHDGVLAVETSAPAASMPTTTPGQAVTDVTAAPCPAPAGGWPPGYGSGTGDTNALIEYLRANDTVFNDVWQAQPDGVAGPSAQPVSMVYVVGTTGDVDAARAELSALYPGNLCVHKVRYSAAELSGIAEQLNSVSSIAVEASPDPMVNGVRVAVLALDEHTAAVLEEVGGDAVILNPPLLTYNG